MVVPGKRVVLVSCVVTCLFSMPLAAVANGLVNSAQGSSITFLKPPTGSVSGLESHRLKQEVLSFITDTQAREFIEAANFDVTRPDPDANTYRVVLSGEGIAVPSDAISDTGRLGLPGVIGVVDADIGVRLDKAWSMQAAHGNSLHVQDIAVKSLRLVWGDVRASGFGDLSVAENGEMAGKFTLTISAWQTLLTLAPLNEAERGSLQQLLSALSNGNDEITLPVTVIKSKVMVGPIVVASIPPLELP